METKDNPLDNTRENLQEFPFPNLSDFDLAFDVWVMGIGLAIGFIISMDYLVYRLEHLFKGNVARLVGMIKAPGLTPDEKFPHLEKSAEEYLKFNARI